MQITGQTKIIGLIGDPVTHSLSPAMHNAAIQHLNLPYVYIPFHVTPNQIPIAINAIRALNIMGVNVTVPHKEAVIPYLDSLDESAKQCGAVNTIVNINNHLTGYNTDGSGLIDSLHDAGFSPQHKKVVILGAGGSARAIVSALLNHKISELILINRTQEKAQTLANSLGSEKIKILPFQHEPYDEIEGTSLVVNTLSVPFKQEGGWLLNLNNTQNALFYDLRYGKMPSDFLTYAKEQNNPGLDGLGMLLWQGVRAFELFTGVKAPVDVMRAALMKHNP